MREIEVKAKLQDRTAVLAAADELGIVFGDIIKQDDTVYVMDVAREDPAWTIFRIRRQGDSNILTMKYPASDRKRDNHERETIFEDPAEMADMLERLGLTVGVRVRKQRRKASYQGLELCLDEVDDLGSFIEVEKLADDEADVDAIQADLWGLLKRLGVAEEDRVHKSYDNLMADFLAQ